MPFTDFKPAETPCMSPEHNPPTHIVLQPGIHTYRCPACGKETVIQIPLVTF